MATYLFNRKQSFKKLVNHTQTLPKLEEVSVIVDVILLKEIRELKWSQ